MKELVTQQELGKIGLTQQELLIKFNTQLIKDFEMCGVQNYLDFLTNFSYAQIHKHIFNALYLILKKQPSKFQQLLYIIDIPEKKPIKIEILETVELTVITNLIIKRILQKVILKITHSK